MTDMTGTIALFDDPAEDPVLEAALDIDATANTIDVVITDEQSADLQVASGTHHVDLIASNGDVIRLACGTYRKTDCGRSEEHTSELRSLMRISYAVFCL